MKRSVTMEPAEAYHGAEYGGPVAYAGTREINLVFSNPGRGAMHYEIVQLSATISVSREDFPQLVDALVMGDWPTTLMDDEKCEAPSTVGEDYSGVKCDGTEIANINNSVIPTGGTGGEGYYRFEPAVTPDHNYAGITVDVKLNQTSAASQVVSGAAPSAANQRFHNQISQALDRRVLRLSTNPGRNSALQFREQATASKQDFTRGNVP